jgi:hypothetical protein
MKRAERKAGGRADCSHQAPQLCREYSALWLQNKITVCPQKCCTFKDLHHWEKRNLYPVLKASPCFLVLSQKGKRVPPPRAPRPLEEQAQQFVRQQFIEKSGEAMHQEHPSSLMPMPFFGHMARRGTGPKPSARAPVASMKHSTALTCLDMPPDRKELTPYTV